MMELPGGLYIDGELRRDFKFKSIDGGLERFVCESGLNLKGLAEQITTILIGTLDTVAGIKANKEVVQSLSSGDRQYLMLQLQILLDPNPKWITSSCSQCEELIQFQYEPSKLPVKNACDSFPKTLSSLSNGDAYIRVPTGFDEEFISKGAVQGKGIKVLLDRIVVSNNDNNIPFSCHEKDEELINEIVEKMSPQICDSVQVECPCCGSKQQLPIDHFEWITKSTKSLEEEIHILAFRYHWSESDILSLPKYRRDQYIKLIEKNLGLYQDEDARGSI